MRTETITRKIYQYDELTDKAKERARDWYRDGLDYSWVDENAESLREFFASFGSNCRWLKWEYDQYTYSVTLPRDIPNGDLTGKKLFAFLSQWYARNCTRAKRYTKGDKARVSRVMRETIDCPFTGFYIDEVLLDGIRDYLAQRKLQSVLNVTLRDVLEDCADRWGKDCRDDYAAQFEDENVEDSIRANEYEFLENGEPA